MPRAIGLPAKAGCTAVSPSRNRQGLQLNHHACSIAVGMQATTAWNTCCLSPSGVARDLRHQLVTTAVDDFVHGGVATESDAFGRIASPAFVAIPSATPGVPAESALLPRTRRRCAGGPAPSFAARELPWSVLGHPLRSCKPGGER